MRKPFPLFQSHLDLAHDYWKRLVQPGDTVIDATCGNGHDTLFLSQLAITPEKGKLYAIDAQSIAITLTKELIQSQIDPESFCRITFLHQNHSHFPYSILPETIKLIVYNLGYLPGQDKNLTTQTDSTLESICNGQRLIQPGGAISVTCYPGHCEGEKELEALLKYSSSLSPKEWSCCQHSWINRQLSPTLLFFQKKI